MSADTRAAPDAGADVVGLLAYAALKASTRLAKDGDQSPSTRDHIDHGHMVGRAQRAFADLEVYAGHRGIDLALAADRYEGLFDDLDARTRPATWWERALKTYVSIGIFADMLRRVAVVHELHVDTDSDWTFGEEGWLRRHLGPATAADPGLAARLSLWGRRVAGETFALARSTLFTHPALAADPQTADDLVASARARHDARMRVVHLRP